MVNDFITGTFAPLRKGVLWAEVEARDSIKIPIYVFFFFSFWRVVPFCKTMVPLGGGTLGSDTTFADSICFFFFINLLAKPNLSGWSMYTCLLF